MLREKIVGLELDGRPLDTHHLHEGELHHDDEHWILDVWSEETDDLDEVFPLLAWDSSMPITVTTQDGTYQGGGVIRRGTKEATGRVQRVIIGHGRLRAVGGEPD